jgi:hypothetical protein
MAQNSSCLADAELRLTGADYLAFEVIGQVRRHAWLGLPQDCGMAPELERGDAPMQWSRSVEHLSDEVMRRFRRTQQMTSPRKPSISNNFKQPQYCRALTYPNLLLLYPFLQHASIIELLIAITLKYSDNA